MPLAIPPAKKFLRIHESDILDVNCSPVEDLLCPPFDNQDENATGSEYDANKKPADGSSVPAPALEAVSSATSGDLAVWEKVTAQGNKIRELKSKKAGKEEIMKEVEVLKTLKAEYKARVVKSIATIVNCDCEKTQFIF